MRPRRQSSCARLLFRTCWILPIYVMKESTPHQILTLQGPAMMKMVVLKTDPTSMGPPLVEPPQTGLSLCILVAVMVYTLFQKIR